MKNKKVSLLNILIIVVLAASVVYFVITLEDYNNEITVAVLDFDDTNNFSSNVIDNDYNEVHAANKTNSAAEDGLKEYNLQVLASRDIFPYEEIITENRLDETDTTSQAVEKQLTEPVQSRNNTEVNHSFELIAISNIITDRRAIIRDTSTNESHIVKPGDSIEDFKVMRIYPEEVILSKNDRWVTISFEGKE